MWEPFHVGLGHQTIHHDIICSPAGVTNIFSQLPKVWAKNYVGSDIVVDPSAHPQHMNDLKHLVYV
jgi:hypothetical protein